VGAYSKGVADVVAGLNRGKAAVEFSNAEEAKKAVKHMDGGQLDGSLLSVQVSYEAPNGVDNS
jgi:RNA recognition motif-containing protein